MARDNDVLVVAPATADLLAKMANGLADDFLTTMYLAFTGPVVLAPAMNTAMWEHPATRRTWRRCVAAAISSSDRTRACWPAAKLARAAWPNRRRSPMQLLAVLQPKRHDLTGESFLITAGPTQEPLDPVRYISNRSSGRMGYALAEAAAARGAQRGADLRARATRRSAGRHRGARAHRRRNARCGDAPSRLRPP